MKNKPNNEIQEVKSLRWLALNFPFVNNPKDNGDRISNAINIYCSNAANMIESQHKHIEDITVELHIMRAERDAAIRDLKSICEDTGDGCEFCKNIPCSPGHDHCIGWEWRGRTYHG